MNQPTRLRDGDGAMRDLLRAADTDTLDGDAVARVRRGVALATAGVATATTAGKAPAWIAAKLAAGLIATGAVVAVVYSLARPAPVAVSAPVAATVSAAVAIPATVAVPTASAESVTASDPVPAVTAPVAKARTVQPPPIVSATVEVAAPPTPREGLLLLQARRALKDDPARALSLVHEHETQFPASQLSIERDKLRREAETKIDHTP